MGARGRLVGVGLLGAVAAVGAIAAVKAVGRRARSSHDDTVDRELVPPHDIEHHHIPTPDGGVLHAVDTGSGPPVVLLHGVTLQWWVWSAVIREMRGRHRVVAWDMRGHGESVAGSRGAGLDAAADDLALLLDHLGLRDAVVVGHSMGGMVLGRFVAHHPDVSVRRVGAMVFLATSAAPLSVAGFAGGLAGLSGAIGAFSRGAARTPGLAYRWSDNDVSAALVRVAFGRRVTARMVYDVRRMLAEVTPRTLAEASSSIAGHDVREELAGVTQPVRVVVGDQDHLTPPAHARALAAAIPHAELVVLPEVGHQVMQEVPMVLCRLISEVGREVDAVATSGRPA